MCIFYNNKLKKLVWYGCVSSSNYILAHPIFECDLKGKYSESKKLLLFKRSKVVKKIDLNNATFERGKAEGIDDSAFFTFTIIDESGEKIELDFLTRKLRYDFICKLGKVLCGTEKIDQVLSKVNNKKEE